jgi:carboxymethylenebutenolidase
VTPTQTINAVEAYVAKPEGAPRGAIILIHEIWGLVDHIKDVADRYAREGYLVVAPDLLSDVGVTPEVGLELSAIYAEPDEERRTAQQPIIREKLAPARVPEFGEIAVGKLRAIVDHLADLPEIGGRIAVTGFCFGGAYAFSLAAADDRVRAAVPFYGTAPEPEKIAQIHCPVLALYGEKDPAIVGPLPQVREAMAAAGVDFESHVYPGAQHAFFNDTNARTYDPDAAADAWRRALAFLGDRLA